MKPYWLSCLHSQPITAPKIGADRWTDRGRTLWLFIVDIIKYDLNLISRVNYAKDNWNLLVKQLMKDHSSIHVINRAQIMDDALNLANSDLLDYETTLSLTGYISQERDYIPWASTLSGKTYLIS